MAARVAKDDLEAAFTTFRFGCSALETALNKAPINQRVLQIKMAKLDEALSALNLAHTAWVSKSGVSAADLVNETYSKEWLSSQWDS